MCAHSCTHSTSISALRSPASLPFFFFIQAFKLKVKHYGGNRGLFPVCSSVSKGALCRVSVTSQTSSTGLPHVETLTSPPRTKKLGRDRWEEGVRVREIENKVCVWVRGRERNPFCSYHLTSAKIKVRSEPKTHLKNLSAVSPFSPANMTHFYPHLPSLSSLSLSLFVTSSVLFGCQSKNLLDPSCFSKCIVFIVFASLSYALPSVLRSALSTLCILTLFTLSAANFPPYPSPYLQ